MATRTTSAAGLDEVEAALLHAVDLLGADAEGEPVACSRVLRVLDQRGYASERAAYAALVRRGVPWSVHLPLVELLGNAGSRDDGPADPEHVDVRLSPVGALALAAEEGAVGPVPLGLIEGSVFRGGEQPPFEPAAVVSALLAGRTDLGPPTFPTGGIVSGDLAALGRGEAVALTLSSAIRAEGGHLTITEIPYGVGPEDLWQRVHDAGAALRALNEACPMRGIEDETSMRDGVRLTVEPDKGTDLRELRDWLLRIPPVSRTVACRLPAPMPDWVRGWDRGDGSGLRALADLMTR